MAVDILGIIDLWIIRFDDWDQGRIRKGVRKYRVLRCGR